jgi:hypothetical protein
LNARSTAVGARNSGKVELIENDRPDCHQARPINDSIR